MLGTVAGEGIGIGDNRGVAVTCMFGGRGGAVACVVGGVWLAAARVSMASGIQWRWRQRQQRRRWRLLYSSDDVCEGVGGVRGGSGNVNGSEGVGVVWGDSGVGNGRRVRRLVSDGVDSSVRDCGGKGNVCRRKRAMEVIGRKGRRVDSFGLSAGQVS